MQRPIYLVAFVAFVYASMSWLLIHFATEVLPFFDIPTWTVRLIRLLLALGFPVALLLAWAFARRNRAD